MTAAPEIAVDIPMRPFVVKGTLAVPDPLAGLVLFAQGGAGRRARGRDRAVVEALHAAGFGTFRLTLLTPDEQEVDERTSLSRFDVDLLAGRLLIAIDWVREQPSLREAGLGAFAAGSGVPVALLTASERPSAVRALVLRNGWPQLAGPALATVVAPTLLVVDRPRGGLLDANRRAARTLASTDKELRILSAADAPRTPRLTSEWFGRFLPAHATAAEHHDAAPVASARSLSMEAGK